MRSSSIVIAVSLLSFSCSKKEGDGDKAKAPDPKVTEKPAPQVKKPVDTKPLPPLAADTGGATGKAQRATAFGGLGIDAPRDLAISATGDAYVAGYFDGEIDFGGTIGKKVAVSKDPKLSLIHI